MTIGDRIRQRRIELGMTQEELAFKLGYKSKVSINKIELNGRNLTQSKIKAVADALDTTPMWIMGWDSKAVTVTDADTIDVVQKYRQADAQTKEMVRRLLAYQEGVKR